MLRKHTRESAHASLLSFLRTISPMSYGPNPALSMYLTEHTSSPGDLSTVCALEGKSIPCPFPSTPPPVAARSVLSWLNATRTVSCQIKQSWAHGLCWYWCSSDHNDHELSRELKMNSTKFTHWKITQTKINTNSFQPVRGVVVTHMPIWAQEGLATQPWISSVPQQKDQVARLARDHAWWWQPRLWSL